MKFDLSSVGNLSNEDESLLEVDVDDTSRWYWLPKAPPNCFWTVEDKSCTKDEVALSISLSRRRYYDVYHIFTTEVTVPHSLSSLKVKGKIMDKIREELPKLQQKRLEELQAEYDIYKKRTASPWSSLRAQYREHQDPKQRVEKF